LTIEWLFAAVIAAVPAAALLGRTWWTLALAALLTFPVRYGVEWLDQQHAADLAQRVEARMRWRAAREAEGCKVTTYRDGREALRPVWTCPDNSTHIEE